MKLKNIFKKKSEKEKPAESRKKTEKKEEEGKEKTAEQARPKEKKETEYWAAYRILKSPHITEKATGLTEKNQYIFKVYPRANKTEVKKAVESVYGVDAVSVRVVNIHAKKRRLGRTIGKKPGYKKAIVKLKEGQKIEVLPR